MSEIPRPVRPRRRVLGLKLRDGRHHGEKEPASLKREIVGCGGGELLEGRLGGFEDLAHGFGAHALDLAQTLGDVEDQAVRGVMRELEIPLRLVTLGEQWGKYFS